MGEWVKQPLKGMELQEKDNKIIAHKMFRKNLQLKDVC